MSSKRSARKRIILILSFARLSVGIRIKEAPITAEKSFSGLAITILRDRASFESRVSIEKLPRPFHRLHRLTETLSHHEVGHDLTFACRASKRSASIPRQRQYLTAFWPCSSLRHVGMDCRQVRKDASGDIHGDLGPGSPCRDDKLTW